jgi:hypothetical protein
VVPRFTSIISSREGIRSTTPRSIANWRETHGPIAGRIKQSRMYVQSHRIPYAGANSSYDGEAEVLIDSIDALAELRI